jgi:RNA polymerase sigma-70 factor (ECF subfamily)
MRLFRSITKLSDEELMREVISHHSHPAITELHRRYSPKLMGYFYKMLNKQEEIAQDFVQDLFLKILEKKHQFDTDKRFYTWVFTIACNMCKTSYRNQYIVSYEDTLTEHGHVTEDLAEKERFHAHLEKSMSNLEHAHKTVFILRHLEHFSLQEIADITEVSLGTVKSRLFYATQKMAEQLKIYEPAGLDQLFKHF